MATGTLDSAASSAEVSVQGPCIFDFSVYGDGAGEYELQRQRESDGSTWRTVEAFTENVERVGEVGAGKWKFRVTVTTYTSGTYSWELSGRTVE